MTQLRRLATVVALMTPATVLAHPDGIHAASFFDGLAHSLTGLDHLLAMLAVGMTAAKACASQRWVAPASFLASLFVGSLAGASGWHVPFTEFAIVCSVFLFGAVALSRWSLPSSVIALLFGTFALFHGIAHGAEADNAGFAYMAGMLLMSGALHALGFGFARVLRAKQARVLRLVARARDAVHQRTDTDLVVRNRVSAIDDGRQRLTDRM
jgi:urease accessory protein